MYNKLLLFISIIIIIIILIIVIHNKYNSSRYDTFAEPKSPKEIIDKDGNMNFNFLKAENSQYVLKKYYLDTDRKINGKKLHIHPYQKKVTNQQVPIHEYSKYLQESAYPLIFGNTTLHRQDKPGQWHKYDTKAQDLYNKYGIRR